MVRLFIRFDGGKYWQLNHQIHRANGPAIVWSNTVNCFWYGRQVTEFELMMLAAQPTAQLLISYDGSKFWFLNEQNHRANGPAVVWADGHCEWYWYDDRIAEFEHMMIAGQKTKNG